MRECGGLVWTKLESRMDTDRKVCRDGCAGVDVVLWLFDIRDITSEEGSKELRERLPLTQKHVTGTFRSPARNSLCYVYSLCLGIP